MTLRVADTIADALAQLPADTTTVEFDRASAIAKPFSAASANPPELLEFSAHPLARLADGRRNGP